MITELMEMRLPAAFVPTPGQPLESKPKLASFSEFAFPKSTTDWPATPDSIEPRDSIEPMEGAPEPSFATTQAAYEEAVAPLFETLDWLEERLSQSRFLCDDTLTEADIRLFTTLVRFDPVYNGHFKCNIRRVIDYKNLWAYTRDIYQIPGVAPTVNFVHIKRHYYQSHKRINPTGVVPVGPVLDFDEPAERGKDVARLLTF